MFGRSVSANILTFLGFLRILPAGRINVQYTIGFITWMLLVVGLTAVFVYFDMSSEHWSFDKSIPGVFSLLSSLVIPASQVVLTIPALSYLCFNNSCLVQDRKSPNPRRPLMFLFDLALYFLYYVIIVAGEPVKTWSGLGLTFLYYGVWSFANVLTCFVIGTSLQHFCREITAVENSASKIEGLSNTLNNLKNGLSPILFVMCSTKCILIVIAALNMANPNTYNSNPALWVSVLAVTLWDLTYITFVVDDTLAAYKGLTLTLRYL